MNTWSDEPHPLSGYGRDRLRDDLAALGVRSGSIVLAQASLRSVRPEAGSAAVVFDALMDVLGPEGTLVVPVFTPLNSLSSRAHKIIVAQMTEDEKASYIESLPVFDPRYSPSHGMGSLAEYVRTRPDAVRSAHPHTSFAAVGLRAVELMKVHDLDCHLGPKSPLGQLYEVDAETLMLGLEYHQGCTMFHMAEYLTVAERENRGLEVRRRDYHARIADATTSDKWVTFPDLDLDESDSGPLGNAFEAATWPGPGLRRGQVGAAECRLISSSHYVAFASAWMLDNRP